jgi:hypothetical protein
MDLTSYRIHAKIPHTRRKNRATGATTVKPAVGQKSKNEKEHETEKEKRKQQTTKKR